MEHCGAIFLCVCGLIFRNEIKTFFPQVKHVYGGVKGQRTVLRVILIFKAVKVHFYIQ